MRASKTSLTWALTVLGFVAGCQSTPQPDPPRITDRVATDVPEKGSGGEIEQVDFAQQWLEETQLTQTTETDAEVASEQIRSETGLLTTGPLALADAESLALAYHPAISEARSQVDSARGQYVQAGLPFNPVLQYRADEVGNDGASGLHSISVSQQYITANKLGIAQQAQARQIQKAEAQLRTAELRVLTRVRSAFAQTLVSQRRVELTRQIVELTEKSVSSVQSLLEAQEVSRIALLQARVEAERAGVAAENAATRLEANRRALAAAIGSASLPDGSLMGDIAEGLTESPWEQLLETITASSPEMAEAGSELERAKWALQLACAQVTPNITGQLGVGVDAATNDTFAAVGVSVPLPIRNRNQGNIRTAMANVAAASAAIDRTRLSLESRLADALGRYQTARQRYVRLTQTVVPDAEATYQLSRTAFEAGETDYLQLLTAQRTLFNTELSVLDSAAEARNALAEIEGLLTNLR